MLFVKLLAHNFCSPKVTAQAIAKPGFVWNGVLEFRDSSWIDFPRFAAALNVSPDRLRACFLDQLGFPQTTPASDDRIRLCPHCLSMGYHSVFFDLGMIEVCPVHKTKLGKPCRSCAIAVKKYGLRKHIKNKDILSTIDAPSDDLYGTACKHIRFDPEQIRWACNSMQQRDLDEWQEWGDQLLAWWRRATQAPGAIPEVVTSAGRISVDGNSADLANRLGFAESIGGKCPWPLVVNPAKTEVLKWKRPFSSCVDLDLNLEARVLFESYRVVRRHIYRTYVKPHRRCWRTLSNLNWLESKALSSESACAVALAYATWRMTIEGFSNVEDFKKRIERPTFTYRIPPVLVDERGAYLWWYAYFFGVLGDIDTCLHGQRFHINCISPLSSQHQIKSDSISWSSMRDENSLAPIKFEYWWLVFPDRHHLMMRAETGCMGRPYGKNAMLDDFHLGSVTDWSWTGRTSEFSMGNSLFTLLKTSPLHFNSRSFRFLTL